MLRSNAHLRVAHPSRTMSFAASSYSRSQPELKALSSPLSPITPGVPELRGWKRQNSPDGRARWRFAVDSHEPEQRVAAHGEDHPAALQVAAETLGPEVRQHDHATSNELVGTEGWREARDDFPWFCFADVDLQAKQSIFVRYARGRTHHADLQVELGDSSYSTSVRCSAAGGSAAGGPAKGSGSRRSREASAAVTFACPSASIRGKSTKRSPRL